MGQAASTHFHSGETMKQKYLRTAHGLKALGVSAKKNRKRYVFNGPDFRMLESFESPGREIDITIDVPEFTTLCPVTGQPDFAVLRIVYRCDAKCVESKSLKLYLMSFRQHGSFHEACVQTILEHLVQLLNPFSLSVEGTFGARGGIAFRVNKTWTR